jgi:hypothetical protein
VPEKFDDQHAVTKGSQGVEMLRLFWSIPNIEHQLLNYFEHDFFLNIMEVAKQIFCLRWRYFSLPPPAVTVACQD